MPRAKQRHNTNQWLAVAVDETMNVIEERVPDCVCLNQDFVCGSRECHELTIWSSRTNAVLATWFYDLVITCLEK